VDFLARSVMSSAHSTSFLQALGYIPDSQPDLQDMLCRWVVAYRCAYLSLGWFRGLLRWAQLTMFFWQAHQTNTCPACAVRNIHHRLYYPARPLTASLDSLLHAAGA